jgi:iron complex transport system substrate-binding protein
MRLPLVLAVMVMLLGAACGQKHEPVGQLPAFPQQADDALGRQVRVLQEPKRVVSLDTGITEAAFRYGAGRQIVGGTGDETFPSAATHLKSMLDETGKIDEKKISKARPDLVIVPFDLIGSAAAADSLALKAGADVYVTDDRSVSGIEHDILQTGLLTGHAAASHGLYTDMQRKIAAIRAPYANDPDIPVFVDRGYFYTIGPKTLAADLVAMAGGENVAANANVSKPFGPQLLRQAAPQVYLAVAASGVTLEGLRRAKATRSVPAIADKRFSIVPDAVLDRGGPRVVDSLRTLARDIHPDLAGSGQSP